MKKSTLLKFNILDKVSLITGGGGLLGKKHAESVLDADGIPVLLDIDYNKVKKISDDLSVQYNRTVVCYECDVTDIAAIEVVKNNVLDTFGRIDILINNATIDPKVSSDGTVNTSRLENFPIKQWDKEIAVGLTGAMQCARIFGQEMIHRNSGVILNISSDLGVIAPNQNLYKKEGIPESLQPVKPVTYSVIKHGLIGLTKYLATYWAQYNIRVNALSPGGVYNQQSDDFVSKVESLIPMGRMADIDEYKSAVLFLISDASSYMTGANLIVDGGRTCW